MNNNCIKPHISESEDSFTVPSYEYLVSVTILLLNSLSALLLDTLLTAAVSHASSNEGGPLQLFRWDVVTGVLNLTSSSGL